MSHVNPSISSGSSPGGRPHGSGSPGVCRVMLFNPLIQPNDALSGVQKYLLRVICGWAGKTILHRGRVVEVLETRGSLHQLLPLVEPDLSESDDSPFWVPIRASDRKRFNIERRDKSRRHRTIGIVWGAPRPTHARRQTLRSVFPPPSFLYHLVTELGYPPDAALAAFARPQKIQGLPDRRRKVAFNSDEQSERKTNKGYQRLDYGDNYYMPEAPSRRTLTGGGFSEKQVLHGLSKMRTDSTMKAALLEVVYKRHSPQAVGAKFGFSRAKLDVYASRLRGHIRREQHAPPALVPSRMDVADLHGGENLASYFQ